MTKTDVQSDLLADLQTAANARPLPPAQAPAGPPPLTESEISGPATPALDVRITPLRWSRPGLVSPGAGSLGVGVRVGPFQWSLTLGG